ncbi:MAG: hypothetical protein PSV16_01560 [Flavobacterium sp.]|nr:hypothetical protein [Flavobacterium sp.]
MNDKKSLDRLFQEKFKDFESEPNAQVWKNIEAALKEKDDRKVIPFWWKLSGVAAVLLIGLFAWNLISDKPTIEKGLVIEQNKVNPEKPSQNNAVVNTENSQKSNSKTLEESQKEGDLITPGGASVKNEIVNPANKSVVPSDNNVVAEESNAVQNTKVQNNKKTTTVNTNKNNAVANSTIRNKKKAPKTIFRSNNVDNALANDSDALNNKSKSNKGKNALKTVDINAVKNNSGIAGVSSAQSKNNQTTKAAASDQHNFGESQAEKAVATNDENKGKKLNDITGANAITNGEKVAIKEVPENNKLDTIPAMIVPNPLEELLKQKNEEETKLVAKESKVDRWQISSNVAPVYFSSTSQGSPIDKQFEGNDKSYDKNLTYGVGVNYAVNKKLSVRAGVQKLNFNYNTNDVVFYAGLGAKAFDNISPAGNAAFLEVMSQTVATSIGLVAGDNSLQDISTGAMTQRMGYIEVPLELSYKLIDRKFGISLIGGVSTLFLNENEVTVESASSGTAAVLGKANNLNDVHFSSNFGVGFKYSFWKDFQFNFEPTFKYQINTFSKDAGNFKPYFIGLYSGVSFSF